MVGKENLFQPIECLHFCVENLEENRELAKEDDEEIAEMAEMEIPELEATIEKLSEDVQYALLPRDEAEDRDALLEIRSGAGGDEAGGVNGGGGAEVAFDRHAGGSLPRAGCDIQRDE